MKDEMCVQTLHMRNFPIFRGWSAENIVVRNFARVFINFKVLNSD